MAVLASSTPSPGHDEASPQQLTPESKLKALLAAIDDGSYIEPLQEQERPQRPVLGRTSGNIQRGEIQKGIEKATTFNTDEEAENGSPVKARGKLAARLANQSAERRELSQIEEDEDTAKAYARIKNQLLRKNTEKPHKPSPDSGSDCAETGKPIPTSRNLSTSSLSKAASTLAAHGGKSITNRRSSPGLFVTPQLAARYKTPEEEDEIVGSDSNSPAEPQGKSRFLELVAKKKAEREAKQAEDDRRKKEKLALQRTFEKELSQDALSRSGSSSDERAADTKLTQQSRPTRKASKKALEEMNRETQRMSRNMQLAHQAKTKKKITKDSLFARFNFRVPITSNCETIDSKSSSTAASSAPATDAEEAQSHQSPPTSPIAPEETSKAAASLGANYSESATLESIHVGAEDDEPPSMLEIMSQPVTKVNKGKGKATDQSGTKPTTTISKRYEDKCTQPLRKIRVLQPFSRRSKLDVDSDSDLEVMPSRTKRPLRLNAFDRQPISKAQEGRSLQTLRALAHLNSPEKQSRSKKASMSLADLQRFLQGRARQQAVEERAAKIEDLKRRGIIVQTAEERQRDQAVVEDLLENARKEGEAIHQKEKRAAKRAKIANGEVDDVPDTSDEDDDYEGEDEADVELSGSEDAESESIDQSASDVSDNDDSRSGDEEGGTPLVTDKPKDSLIDDQASEDLDVEEHGLSSNEDNEQIEENAVPRVQRSRRSNVVIEDDEDDDWDEKIDDCTQSQKPAIEVPFIPTIFGESNNMIVPMGMTQAFAATMADTQTQAYEYEEEQDSLAFLGPPPEPDVPMFEIDDMIEDSQDVVHLSETNKDIDLHFSQSQICHDTAGDSADNSQGLVMATQMSEIPDPTQDVGYVMSSPVPQRFASPPRSTVATVDTILLPGAVAIEMPPVKRRGRLQRRTVIEHNSSDEDIVPAAAPVEIPSTANAFDAMEMAQKKAATKAAKDAFDKKKSEAKGMVEEQAQESEDEFQGIGGPSDDDSGGEEDEYARELIDQEEVDVDERHMAAFYA